MIHVFNAPIDPVNLPEFAENRGEGDDELFPLDEQEKRKPKVTYTKDGRRMLNGVVEEPHSPTTMWNTALVGTTARRWKRKCTSVSSMDGRDGNEDDDDYDDSSYFGSIKRFVNSWLRSKTFWSVAGVMAAYVIYRHWTTGSSWLPIKFR